MRIIITLIALFFLSFAGCKDETTSTSSNINNVSVWSSNDSLAISIAATNHNYNDTFQISFTADTVNLMMSVNGYGQGSGYFKVFRDTNTVISKNLGSNYSISERKYTGIPTKAVIYLENYKGNTSILLSK